MTDNIKLPPMPEWAKMDNLNGMVPSEIRSALSEFACEAVRLNAQGGSVAPQLAVSPYLLSDIRELAAYAEGSKSPRMVHASRAAFAWLEGAQAALDEERLAMEAVMESVDPATWPRLTAAQRCALGRFAKPQPAVPDEPDWRHPKIQGLIGSEARLRITIDLMWQILENPNQEFGPSDMEYWDTIHDKLKEALSTKPAAPQPAQQERKRRYAQGTALGEFGIIPVCDQVDDEPVKVPSDALAHEIWAAAQTAPGEGIEDAVERVAALLARRVHHDVLPWDSAKRQEQPQHVEADGTGE
jgi:hypothetical protein